MTNNMTEAQLKEFEFLMKMSHEHVCREVVALTQENTVLRHRIMNCWHIITKMDEQITESEGQYTAEILKHFRSMFEFALNDIMGNRTFEGTNV